VYKRQEYKYVADVVTELGPLPPVMCHGGEINQVILNLVINAAHAIAERNAKTDERGTIAVSTREDGDTAVIAIRDTGTGIAEHVRGRIFDPFFTTKAVGHGTGQGLAISRSVVVDKHHGTLTFDTELGQGTTFYIRLPIAGYPDAMAA
jgi:signal transduction histidine kinase